MDFLDRRTEGFRRVSAKTAIAHAGASKNVILDEPTNGLDVMTTRRLRAFLQAARSGIA
jgi:sodium transport system ATP-binding protein